MNRYIIYTVIGLIFFSSCIRLNTKKISLRNSPNFAVNDFNKDKYGALNDYLDDEIKKIQSKEIMIMTEKLSVNMTLDILKTNDIWAVDSTEMARKDQTFFKEEDWQKLREENGDNSLEIIENHLLWKKECCWSNVNFRYKKLIFENLEFGKKDFEKKYFSSPDYYVFWFSEPVYYKNKTYVIFVKCKGSLSGANYPTRLIIMKKIKNKWVQVYEGIPDWHS